MTTPPNDQYDSPWKEAIEEYFTDCLAFFFPNIYADIDWSQGYQFLDKELEKAVREATVSRQHVDKLARVYRLSGEETWVMVHIDIQSQYETSFSERMYMYNYRLFDRYHLPVVTLVIDGDQSKRWQPQTYHRSLWGCQTTFEFPTIKLLDYDIGWLEHHVNPFAVVILAHLHTKATKHKPEERFEFKWRLARMLYERGYNAM